MNNALAHRRAQTEIDLEHRLRQLEGGAKSFVELPSEPMRRLYERLARIATVDHLPVLIRGETGVGKEHVCRLVHELSPRAGAAFVSVNCAAFERGLLSSELFGHERGSFTGASERRRGPFELARQGTLFLDEVAEMPPDTQAVFLRVLESGQFRRLGGSVELETDARVVAASNMDLEKLKAEGRLRRTLADLLRILHMGRRSAAIEVWCDEDVGAVYVGEGKIVHATFGEHEGIEAWNALARWRELCYTVEADARPGNIGMGVAAVRAAVPKVLPLVPV